MNVSESNCKAGPKLTVIKLLVLSLLLSSCALGSKTSILKTSLFGTRGNLISPQQLQNQWHSVIQVTLGKNKATLKKQGQNGNTIFWQGIDAAMLTENGRVIQLTGPKIELRKSISLQADPLGHSKMINGVGFSRKLDYMPNYFYDIKAKSKFTIIGMQNINVLGFKRRLLKVQETVFFENFNRKLTNTYWLNPQTMRVWKSKQYYAPHAKPIILEQVFLAAYIPNVPTAAPALNKSTPLEETL